jgi:hypothetical protein
MSSRLTRDDARALGLEILRKKPDPVVRVRLLRDVLCVSREDPRLREARTALEDSVHLAALRGEQRADGSWGRLHSRDTSARGGGSTTEWAVERLLALGLEVGHPVIDAAAQHLASILEGRTEPADPPEKNDRWAAAVRLFAAATLARIDAAHPALDAAWDLWHEIARRTFASGTYDARAEIEAHRALTGASVAGTYLVLSNRYALTLLAARAARMDDDVRRALALWIGQKGDGVGYFGIPLAVPPQGMSAGSLERFLQSHEVAARFGVSGAATGPLADWLGRHRHPDGLWDLGPRVSWTAELPLSETWRRANARATDWTVRVLALLTLWMA